MFAYICLDRNGNVSFENDPSALFSSEIVVQIDTYDELLTVIKDRSSQNLHVSVKKLKYLSSMFEHSIPVDIEAKGPHPTYYDLVTKVLEDELLSSISEQDTKWLEDFSHRFM